MTKAKRMMQENIKLIDVVIELVDARIPLASRNPDIDELAKGKARIVLFNKSDLADEKKTAEWKRWFENKGIFTALVNSKNGKGVKAVQETIQEACKEKVERDRKRGIKNRPIRAMVVGIPNVGKSTFINSFAGKACTKTGNKPGVTKGKQWIRLNKNVELLDTPGILWPKFEDQKIGLNLAFVGSIKDEIMNTTELAAQLLSFLLEQYPQQVEKRYDIIIEESENPPLHALEQIARKRACLVKGGELDYDKAAALLLDEFRNGQLGRITLEQREKPDETVFNEG
jgi:ribosome biogenesis GTPase A